MNSTLCAYTRLHPATEASLKRFAPDVDLVDVTGDDFAYWRAIASRWGLGDLTIVEHDIELHAEVVPAFTDCKSPWCVFPYQLMPGIRLDRGLGCTRFRADCQLIVTAAEIQSYYGSCGVCDPQQTGANMPGCWLHLDGKIAAALEGRGLRACVHLPAVRHHNPNSF